MAKYSFTSLCGLLLMLTACSMPNLHALREAKPAASAYHRELASVYLGLAEEEAAHYNWSDAEHFAEKGLMASWNKSVEPDDPTSSPLDAGIREEMREARLRLKEAVHTDNMLERPRLTAEAVYYYDCWLHTQEGQTAAGSSTHCRDQFYERLSLLQSTDSDSYAAAPPDSMPEPEIVGMRRIKNPDGGYSSSRIEKYIIFFPPGRTQMSDEGDKIIRTIAANLEPISDYLIIINGHTDRPGPATINTNLALNRARQVGRALVLEGVDEQSLHIFSFGESDPRIPTADDVSEDGNRRVEIFVSG